MKKSWKKPEIMKLDLSDTKQGSSHTNNCDDVRTDSSGNRWYSYTS